MSEVLVNTQPVPMDSGQKTWADVLAAVDARAAADGHVVTAVRFGGVDQPSFRDAGPLATALAAAGRIEVETVPRARLLGTTLGAAGLSLPEIAGGACRTAALFRRGQLADAHDQLAMLFTTVRTLVELTLASAAAADVDLEHLACGGRSGADVLGATALVLDTLSQHQQVDDWVALADELEYALAPAILEWRVVFEAMQEASAS